MGNTGFAALGIGGIGFGVLLIYSAYTGKPLFGADGLIRRFLGESTAEQFGRAAGKALNDVGKSFSPSAEESRRPLNPKPPGA